MIRKDAIRLISKEIESDVIVSANGYISRDLFEVNDKLKFLYDWFNGISILNWFRSCIKKNKKENFCV